MLLSLLGLVCLLKWGLPAAMKWGIERYSGIHSPWHITLDSLTLGLRKGEIGVQGLRFQSGDSVPISLDSLIVGVEWGKLLQGRLQIHRLQAQGLTVSGSYRNQQLSVAGLDLSSGDPDPQTPSSGPADPGGSKVLENLPEIRFPAVELTDFSGLFQLPSGSHQLKIHQATVGPFQLGLAPAKVPFQLTGSVHEAAFIMSGSSEYPYGFTQLKLTLEKLSMEPLAALARELGGVSLDVLGQLGLEGDFQLQLGQEQSTFDYRLALKQGDIQIKTQGQHLSSSFDRLALQGQFATPIDLLRLASLDHLNGTWRQQVNGEQLQLKLQAPSESQFQFEVSSFKLNLGGVLGQSLLSLENFHQSLGLAGITLHLGSQKIRLASDQLEVIPKSALFSLQDNKLLRGNLSLKSEGFSLQQGDKTFTWQSLGLDGMRFENVLKPLHLDQISLNALALNDGDKIPVLKIGKVEAKQLSAQGVLKTQTKLSFNSLAVKDLILRDPHGETIPKNQKATHLNFRDLDLQLISEEKQSVQIARLGFGSFGEIQGRRTFRYDGEPQETLEASFTALDLIKLSPLLRQQMGYQVQQGHLNGNLSYKVTRQGSLGGGLQLNLSKIQIEKFDSQGDLVSETLGMPLSTALSLATNDEGNLSLKFPLTGHRDDPDFKWSVFLGGKLSDVLLNQLTSAVGVALAQNILPLVTSAVPMNPAMAYQLVKKGWRSLENLRLKPITFDGTANTPSEEGQRYMETIATQLKKQPDMTFTFCTDAAIREADGDRDTSLQQARQRLALVERSLVQGYQVSPQQVVLCEPKIAVSQSPQQPKVTLTL